MKEKEIIDKLKELQNDSFEWTGGEDLIDFIKNLKKENEELKYKVSLNELDKDYVEREFVPKDKIREIIKEELPDDDICKSCERYDVNGVVIKQKLIKVLEEE